MSSLGAATSIFSQPGLIVNSLREVVNILEHGICLRKEAAQNPSGAFVLADEHLAAVTGTLNAQAFRRQRWAGTGLYLKDNVLEKRRPEPRAYPKKSLYYSVDQGADRSWI
jgi:hypothetical protein